MRYETARGTEMSILQLVQGTVAFGLDAPDLLPNVIKGRLEASRVLRRAPGLGPVGWVVADDGVAGGIVGEVSVEAQLAIGQLLLAPEPMELTCSVEEWHRPPAPQ